MSKVADAEGIPSPAPTTTASVPVMDDAGGATPPETTGHGEAEVSETLGGQEEEKDLLDRIKDALPGREE